MLYTITYYTHVTSVTLSILFFVVRGGWMITDSSLLQSKAVRVLPHVIDTVLLASALTLAVMLRQYPFVSDWVTAKVIALIAYILLGMVALRRGKTKQVRIFAFVGALLVVAYIVMVALHHDPLGPLGRV